MVLKALSTWLSSPFLLKYVPRRLTPRETWRLMGVCDEDIDKASQLISQTSLYKQSGNSIVVSVLEAIFKELFLD